MWGWSGVTCLGATVADGGAGVCAWYGTALQARWQWLLRSFAARSVMWLEHQRLSAGSMTFTC